MIALDTNVLVYAFRPDVPQHAAAAAAVSEVVGSGATVGVPWPCVHEFVAITSHPRVFSTPSDPVEAVAAIDALLAQDSVRTLGESRTHLNLLRQLLDDSGVRGPKVHDARIAAICLGHGVTELWTADRDFSYFPALRTHNPLVRGR